MPCTATGIVSIALAVTALALSSIALALPMWASSSSIQGEPTDTPAMLHNVQFSVGVWGYCINADLTQDYNHITLDQCFSFYSSRDITNALRINGTAVATTLNNAAIEMNSSHAALCDLPDLGSATALLTPLKPLEYNAFVSRSCGSLGKASLSFAALSSGFGALTCLTLLVCITCCSAKSCFVSLAKVFGLLSFTSSVVTFGCWTGQATDLTNVSFGISFAFEVAAAALYALIFVALVFHQKRGIQTEGKVVDPSP
ncbi:hypothetical protein DYB37_010174 [Aphanomyces astaci]|uniref:Membrane-associated protein n=1 Tax=Aphanomyces astaci TaxID=112090 RepID=A0A3R6YPR5_APHAT|nr:hypothetical protein DYB35_009738 [Aphanomyces astaci]RHZ20931.1 hypothetical protein DYB37_010174 [Aphanomyces astaci]